MRSLYFRSSYFDSIHKSNCNRSNQTAISAIRLQSQQSDCNLPTLQYDCGDCSLIVEIAVWLLRLQKLSNLHIHAPTLFKVSGNLRDVFFWLLRLQSDCWDCSLIAEIAVRLLRLQSVCWDCSLTETRGMTKCICKLRNFCNLCNQSKTPRNMPDTLCRVGAPYVSCETFAISAIGLQS